MKEVVLRMEDSDYQKFMGMVSLCPTVKVVYDGNCDDGRDIEDKCFAMAIIELRKSNAFKTPGDYAYVMKAVNEGVISISTLFTSPKKFISYMYVLGLDNLPGRNTIYDALNKTSGK